MPCCLYIERVLVAPALAGEVRHQNVRLRGGIKAWRLHERKRYDFARSKKYGAKIKLGRDFGDFSWHWPILGSMLADP